MSRSFLGFGQVPYIGQPGSQAIKLGSISGVCIPLLFQWLSYGASTANPNINVLVHLEGFSCKALDQIRTIYIDNLGSDTPIYVYFPDTGYTVVAKPNSEGWYPAFTNAKQIWVVGEGFLTGDIPQTFILLSNVPLEASVNNEIDNAVALWRASPVITRGTSIFNAALGIPALGDQFFSSAALDLSIAGATAPLWNTPYASGFLYVTSIILSIPFVNNVGAAAVKDTVLESTGVAGILMDPRYLAGLIPAGGQASVGIASSLNFPGLQLKLDATQTWRMRVVTAAAAGNIQMFSSFTQQP